MHVVSLTPKLVSNRMAVPRARVRGAGQPHVIIKGKQMFSGGHAESLGKRPTMEDACAIIGEFAGPGTQFYGVFDGHGGNSVAIFCATEFPGILARHFEASKDMEESLKAAIAELNETAMEKWPFIGSTLAVAVIADNILYTANVGDSRIILIRDGAAWRKSQDHKISDESERQEVEARGGLVLNGRVGGTLALSRAIGDGSLRGSLSATPFLTRNEFDAETRLIIACDGVWDVMTDDAAGEIFMNAGDPASGARAIKDEALKKGTDDNVTVICVHLAPKAQ